MRSKKSPTAISIRRWLRLSLLLLLVAASAVASAANTQLNGRLVLVLPFENQSQQPGLDWIGESFPDLLNQRLHSAGFLPIRHEDRQYALQHLGLPKALHPTHATIYRIAQTLDVDDVILGSYTVANGQVKATANILEMHGPKMDATLEESASLNQLLDVEDGLAWQIARQIDPTFAVEKQTFLAASNGIRLDTLENYIRGEMDSPISEKIRHFKTSVQLSPDFSPALLALGKTYFDNKQYGPATEAFSRIPANNPRFFEAQFYSGLADLYTSQYPQAANAFATVAAVLPLPEVLNNQGVALSRQGKNGISLFQRAAQLDPQSATDWLNLAISERRIQHKTKALDAVKKSLEIRPNDPEALRLKEHLLGIASPLASDSSSDSSSAPTTAPTSDDADTPAATASTPANTPYDPLERIERKYNETSFRQAAFELEQMRALKLQSLPPAQQAAALCSQGQSYIDQGLLLEAERQYQQALIADPSNALAHAGLAQIRALTGNPTSAREQAHTSLQLQPNVAAYLVLVRLDMQQNQREAALVEVQSALKLDPNNAAATSLLHTLQTPRSLNP